MATRPTEQKRWPTNAERARTRTIELADDVIALLSSARQHLDKRDHPALVALDLADAMRYLADIKLLMSEAKNGIE